MAGDMAGREQGPRGLPGVCCCIPVGPRKGRITLKHCPLHGPLHHDCDAAADAHAADRRARFVVIGAEQ